MMKAEQDPEIGSKTIRSDWVAAPTFSGLPEGKRVDLWRLPLPQTTAGQPWDALLAEDERGRAARFRFEKDRAAYMATRGTLRMLLGQYLRIAPETVHFVYSRFGKPALDPQQHPDSLKFNVSHSRGYAVLAFGMAMELGVDVEYGRKIDADAIMSMVCAQSEREGLERLEVTARDHAFVRLWTHKEAVLKAIGCGLSEALDALEFAFTPTGAVQLVRGIPEMGNLSDWSLCEVDVHPDYAAAFAARANSIDLKLWDLVKNQGTMSLDS